MLKALNVEWFPWKMNPAISVLRIFAMINCTEGSGQAPKSKTGSLSASVASSSGVSTFKPSVID